MKNRLKPTHFFMPGGICSSKHFGIEKQNNTNQNKTKTIRVANSISELEIDDILKINLANVISFHGTDADQSNPWIKSYSVINCQLKIMCLQLFSIQ